MWGRRRKHVKLAAHADPRSVGFATEAVAAQKCSTFLDVASYEESGAAELDTHAQSLLATCIGRRFICVRAASSVYIYIYIERDVCTFTSVYIDDSIHLWIPMHLACMDV